jgi:uncharacterized protein (UPF0332 family)
LKAKELMVKAVRATVSAKVLLDAGDADGACNRAYYAMFDAARAALLASGHEVGKTHRGLLNSFANVLIRNDLVPKEMGRLLKRAETFRYVADYSEELMELSDALEMVVHAENFVDTLQNYMNQLSD